MYHLRGRTLWQPYFQARYKWIQTYCLHRSRIKTIKLVLRTCFMAARTLKEHRERMFLMPLNAVANISFLYAQYYTDCKNEFFKASQTLQAVTFALLFSQHPPLCSRHSLVSTPGNQPWINHLLGKSIALPTHLRKHFCFDTQIPEHRGWSKHVDSTILIQEPQDTTMNRQQNHYWRCDALIHDSSWMDHNSPSLKQTGGSVVSWNPEQMAFITAPLSSFPEDLVNKHNVIPGENLSTYTMAIYRVHNYFFIIKYTLITEAVLKEVPINK